MTPLPKIALPPLILFASLLMGCSQTKPPMAEMQDAARRVDSAREAGASTYAPGELRVAQERLGIARASMKEEDYDQAAPTAEEAAAAGDLALAKTRLGKARERADARTRENEQLRNDLAIPANPPQQEGFH